MNFFIVAAILILLVSVLFCFEKSRPKPHELVLMAQLSVISVCARAVFSVVPYFNPVMALLIVWGTVLGAQKGFVIGVLTAFAGNFIFGQGIWTVFQCFSWGICGAVFGFLGKAGFLSSSFWTKKERCAACAVSFFMIVFVTGPVSDLSSFVAAGVKDFQTLKLIFAGGFFFNVTLALSTAATLFFCANPLLRILKRAV